jgi:hypothetical protein
MEGDFLARFAHDMIERLSGPMTFRLVLQPLMAIVLAVVDGLKDAKNGNPPFLWAVFTHRGHRRATLKHGWKSIGRVFLFALTLDFVYEIVGQPAVYPDEAIAVAIILAILPYLLLRGAPWKTMGGCRVL